MENNKEEYSKSAQGSIAAKEKMDKLREAATPLLKLLNSECHPHCTIIMTSTSIELVEGIVSIPNIHDYLVD